MDCMPCRIALVLAFVTAWSGVVRGTDDGAKTTARDLAKAAKRDFDAGHLEDAELKFRRAYAIAKVPKLAVWTARVLVKRGQLVAGAELYRQALQLTRNDLWLGNAQEQAQSDAKRELEALQARIPHLRIHVQGTAPGEVQLTVDQVQIAGPAVEVDLPADPGSHRVVGKGPAETLELVIDLLEGEGKDAFLKFKERASAAVPAAIDNEPTTKSAAKALLVFGPRLDGTTQLTTDPLSPEQPVSSTQPVYTKWWFWTGIGAVAIAGTVTALVLTRHPGGACSGASYPCTEVP